VGIGLIALVLLQGYRTTARAFRRDPVLGGLLVAYVVTSAIYNVTEAGFRMLDLAWFFLLLSVVSASRLICVREGTVQSTQALAGQASALTEIPSTSASLG